MVAEGLHGQVTGIITTNTDFYLRNGILELRGEGKLKQLADFCISGFLKAV